MIPVLTDVQFAALPEDDQEEYLRVQAELVDGEGLADFIRRISPHHPPPKHFLPIIAEIERCLVERRKICISMPPRHGKAVASNTPMMTGRGWIAAGDVRVGDRLVGSDGCWTEVLGVFPQGVVPLFRVGFSDGSSLITSADHLWSVSSRYGAKDGGRRIGGPERIKTTAELSTSMAEADGRKRWRIPVAAPMKGEPATLPLDPYLFGLWLGDGHSNCSHLTTADQEVVRAFETAGMTMTPIRYQNAGRATTYLVGGLHRILRPLGMVRNKHVPAVYLAASAQQRLALLQGLCDTDGTVAKDGSLQSFTTTSPALSLAFRRLVGGLGGKCTLYRRPAARKTADTYQFRLPTGLIAFRMGRKARKLRVASPRNVPRRLVASIERVGAGPAVCFQVAATDKLFCAGDDFIVTHNTTLILHAFAWWLSRFPADTNAYYSYNSDMGRSKSVLARGLAERAGVNLSAELNTKSEWRTLDGGGLLAGGVDSGLTGQGVSGLLVIDDPFKGPIDAYSQHQRDAVFEWFKTVPMTRREGASVFVIHTRWHEDDLIGRLEKTGDWVVINFPAVAGDDDWLGDEKREPGSVLWPERFSTEDIDERRRVLGEFNFAALYQGRPRPRGGTVFGEPRYYDPSETSFEGCAFVLGADPAASEKTSADYSAAVVISMKGRGADAMGYVRFVYRKQVAIPVFVTALHDIQQKFGNTAVNVESVGGFKAVPQMLLALGLERINEIIPVGDKFTRAQAVAAAWNSGRLLVPADSPSWLGEFLDELAKFTGVRDVNDDQVDALAHAWNSGPKISMWDVL